MDRTELEGGSGAALPIGFSRMRVVPEGELSRRIEDVKTLSERGGELYRIVKDAETGEHYLHYASYHLNVAGGGAEEHYHHLLPLAHDDVIAYALGAEWPAYPSEWRGAYLRNGPHGGFVWYDPDGASMDESAYEEAAAKLKEKLLAFRRSGARGEEETRRLLEDIERELPPAPDR